MIRRNFIKWIGLLPFVRLPKPTPVESVPPRTTLTVVGHWPRNETIHITIGTDEGYKEYEVPLTIT